MHRKTLDSNARVGLTLGIRRGARYCSFVDNVSDIVNESIRPDLIVGRNKARRDARVTDAFICGNVTCRVPQERNVSTSSYVSRPMTIALDYTRRKTILAVSLLASQRASVISLIYARYRGKETHRSERKSVDITKSRGSRQHLVMYPTFLYILHYR